ncbi:MAG: hypothetical protein ACLSFA_05465 [Roseburia inulinivorans]
MFCISGKEMGAPTGNWLYDSARDLTEMASMQFAVYGLDESVHLPETKDHAVTE